VYLAEEYSFFIFFVDFLFIILSLIVELYILDHHALEEQGLKGYLGVVFCSRVVSHGIACK
jgi:hypothetical protein